MLSQAGTLPSLSREGTRNTELHKMAYKNSCLSLRDKLSTTAGRSPSAGTSTIDRAKVDGDQQTSVSLEEKLTAVRQTYQALLMSLKELELGRIDLQATAQWLSSARRSWKLGHERCLPVKACPELDRHLAEEEHFFANEVSDVDRQIAQVSAQVARVRSVKDALERGVTEQRRNIVLSGKFLQRLDQFSSRAGLSLGAPSSARETM